MVTYKYLNALLFEQSLIFHPGGGVSAVKISKLGSPAYIPTPLLFFREWRWDPLFYTTEFFISLTTQEFVILLVLLWRGTIDTTVVCHASIAVTVALIVVPLVATMTVISMKVSTTIPIRILVAATFPTTAAITMFIFVAYNVLV